MSGTSYRDRETGAIISLTPEGEWLPARRVRNPQTGEELFNDGSGWRPVPPVEAPRAPDGNMRQIGLGTRATAQGLAALPGALYDAAGAGINALTSIPNALGANIPRVRTARENVGSVADAVGLPQPQTYGERMMGASIEGAASIIPSMGAGAALQGSRLAAVPTVEAFSAQAAPAMAPAALNTFAQSAAARYLPERVRAALPATAQAIAPSGAPTSALVTIANNQVVRAPMQSGGALTQAMLGPMSTQIGAGAGGAALQQEAVERGAGVPVQIAANLIGGLGGAGAVETARGGGRLVSAMLQPFSEAGRARIAGEALAGGSFSPETLASRLQAGLTNPEMRLPTSVPTTAQAALDPALMRVESSVRGGALGVQPQTVIGDADFARNASRTAALEGMGDGSFPEVRGATIRTALEGAEQGQRARVNQLFDIARDRNSSRYSVQPILEAADDATRVFTAPGGGGIPTELQGVLDDIAGIRLMELSTAQNLRSRLGDIAGRASSQQTPDSRLAAVAGQISDRIEATLDDPRWMAAVAERRTMGADLGRDATGTSATGAVLRTDRFGAPLVADQQVPARILNNPDALRQTIRASLKAIDDARTAQIGAPGRAARSAFGEATPNPDQLLAQHRDMMRALRGQFVENLMASASTTAQIMNTGGGTGTRLSVAKANDFFKNNNRIAQELFEPREYQQLSRIAADFLEGSRSATTGSTTNSQTAQNLSVANMIARTTNGLVSSNSATTNPALRAIGRLYRGTEDMTRDMFARALVDPQFAASLLAKANPENLARIASQIEMTRPQAFQNAVQDAAIRQTTRTAPELSQPQE